MQTLKLLKDKIYEILKSKRAHDLICREKKQPIETLEQYLYTFYQQKYGLKQLAIEHVAALVNSLTQKLKLDPQIAVFAKILKNECEEGFD